MQSERWPPVYDADDLIAEIKRLTSREDLSAEFFEWRKDRSVSARDDVCQGDVTDLPSEVPIITESGEPFATTHPGGKWLVIGNTCDFVREEVQWTQLVPLVDVGATHALGTAELAALKRYTQSRRFFVPNWSAATLGRTHVADFLRPVAVDKRAFATRVATVEARMSRPAWILLNACLVRFLARDDGRYDDDD